MSEDFVIKDGGDRQQYEGGSIREPSTGKPRPDLISPFFLERLGRQLARGADKYPALNWAKGLPSSRCYESCMRHLMQYAQGQTDEDHLAAAAFNIMVIIHNQEVTERDILLCEDGYGYDNDDMPKFTEKYNEEASNAN